MKIRNIRDWLIKKRLFSAALIVVFISSTTLLLELRGLLNGFEYWTRGLFFAQHSSSSLSYVRIVGIDDRDLPFSAKQLGKLICAIASMQPKAIGVDIDTSLWSNQDVRVFEECLQAGSSPPVIWARDVSVHSDGSIEPLAVLGGTKPIFEADTGLAVFPIDSDGLSRRSTRRVDVAIGKKIIKLPTLQWALANAANPMQASENLEKGDELIVNLVDDVADLKPISARIVLGWTKEGQVTNIDYFKDKIVLIGNISHESQDQRLTPIGEMQGVQFMALAVESELDGGGIQFSSKLLMFGLDLLLGGILIAVHQILPLSRALAVTACLVLMLMPVCSYFAFCSFRVWFNFVPIIVAILAHYVCHHLLEYRRLYKQELQRCKASVPRVNALQS